MVQETSKIVDHIETERARLAENLEEFESRIKEATSPRAWFDRKPGWIVGAVAATGFVLALLITPSRR
jgi:hypothetical protein